MELKKAIENHRKMWNWIADETEKQKRAVDKWEYYFAMKIFLKIYLLKIAIVANIQSSTNGTAVIIALLSGPMVDV